MARCCRQPRRCAVNWPTLITWACSARIWYDLTRRAQVVRFERALRDALPGEEADAALSDAARTWLWRSLRDAEAAGLDGGKVLRLAVAARPLTDARDPARVIDARIRRMIEHAVPRVPRSWAERVPRDGRSGAQPVHGRTGRGDG